MARIDDKQKALRDALRIAGHVAFTDKSYSSKVRDAQLNLAGRSHYVDDSTMRYFKSRITYAGDHCHGLIYALVESLSLDYNHKRRGFRPVLFDVFGTVIDSTDLKDCWTTSDGARKAMYAKLDALDVLAHYREAIDSMKARLLRESKQLTNCRRLAK